MILPVEKSDHFLKDFDIAFEWYADQAGEDIALRYFQSIEFSVRLLAEAPDLGVKCKFKHPSLRGMRFFLVQRPFEKHLIFYRHNTEILLAERIMHGSRNLARRLRELPGN